MSTNPSLSVILPVYNGGELLAPAVQSILDQTYSDFEIIAINDGSKDESLSVLESFTDPRLKVFTQENKGLIGTLNRGIELSQGKYIVRVDQDDICVLNRFEMQVAFLDEHEDYGLVGSTYAVQIDEKVVGISAVLLDHESIKRQLLFKNPFGHGTTMFRKSLGESLKGEWYADWAVAAEDYELWSRIALVTKVCNLPEPLYIWRDNPLGISSSQAQKQRAMQERIAARNQKMPEFRLKETLRSTRLVEYRNEPIKFQGSDFVVRRGFNNVELQARLAFLAFKSLMFPTAIRLLVNAVRIYLRERNNR